MPFEWIQRGVRRSKAEHHCVAHEEKLFPRQPLDVAKQGFIGIEFREHFGSQQTCEAFARRMELIVEDWIHIFIHLSDSLCAEGVIQIITHPRSNAVVAPAF